MKDSMRKIHNPRALLLDMDGLIIDSEPIALETLKRFASEKGFPLNQEIIDLLIGSSYIDFFNFVCTKFSFLGSSRDTMSDYFIMLNPALEKEAIVLPGVLEFLMKYKEKYDLALVSGSLRSQIDLILNKFHFNNFFRVIVSAEDVKNGKPSPEPYVFAQRILGVNREDCIVFEDSGLGVESAKSAGMYCVGVRIGSGGNQTLSKADLVINSFQDFDLSIVLTHYRIWHDIVLKSNV